MGSRSKSSQTRREQRQGNRRWWIWPDLTTWSGHHPLISKPDTHLIPQAKPPQAMQMKFLWNYTSLKRHSCSAFWCIQIYTLPILSLVGKYVQVSKLETQPPSPFYSRGSIHGIFPQKKFLVWAQSCSRSLGISGLHQKNTPYVLCHNCFHNKCRIDQKSWCFNITCVLV